jgi:hypothetical protein
MALVRVTFAALVCAIAISFATDLLFLDYFGPFIGRSLSLLSFAFFGWLLPPAHVRVWPRGMPD